MPAEVQQASVPVAVTDRKEQRVPAVPGGRVTWIDLAKGAGILLVAMGHLTNGAGDSVWLPALGSMHYALYLFHMPLFFLLGGMVFRTGGRTPREFAAGRARGLLVCYYVFSLYFLAKPLVMALAPGLAGAFGFEAGTVDLGATLWDILIDGNGLWFLWAYFWAQLIAFVLVWWLQRRLGERSCAELGVELALGCLLVMTAHAWHIACENPDPPFQLLRGVWGAGYVLIGHALASAVRQPGRVGSLVFGTVCLAVFVRIDLELVGDREPSLWGAWLWGDPTGLKSAAVSLVVALMGSLAVMFFARAWEHNAPLEAVGRESLAYYALSPVVMNACKLLVFSVLGASLAGAPFIAQLAAGLALSLASMALSAPISALLTRLAPWLLGRCRK